MKTKKVALVTIALKRNFTCKIEFDTLEDPVSSVHKLLTEVEPFNYVDAGDFTTVTLPECEGGSTYRWNPTLDHYCFGEGHISETRMADEMFAEENAL
jgi:hypothetical protein